LAIYHVSLSFIGLTEFVVGDQLDKFSYLRHRTEH